MRIHELDTVTLSHDIEEYGLRQGDIGAVVHCYTDHNAFEVEFVTGEGETVTVLTLTRADVRLREPREFIEYVKMRTNAAKQARERGEHCTSLEELQQEYA